MNHSSKEEEEEKVDDRPEISPYESNSVCLRFDSGNLTIPRGVLDKCPDLAALSTKFRYTGYSEHADLSHISKTVGHVIVHYLFTGTYEGLKPTETTSPREKLKAEFRTGIQVYVATATYDLGPLRELARGEVARLGGRLTATETLDVVMEVNPDVEGDTWFRENLHQWMRPLLDEPRSFLEPATLDLIVGASPITKVLVATAFGLFCELADTLRDRKESATVAAVTVARSEEDEDTPNGQDPESGDDGYPADALSVVASLSRDYPAEGSLAEDAERAVSESELGPEPAGEDPNEEKVPVPMSEEPEPILEPIPEMPENDPWDSLGIKKKEKKKLPVPMPEEPEPLPAEPEPEPMPDPEILPVMPESDPWDSLGTKKKKKKKRHASCATWPDIPVSSVAEVEPDGFGGFIY